VRGIRCLLLLGVRIFQSQEGEYGLHLAITTLVNQLAYRLEIWVTVGDIRLNNAKHLNGGLRKTDENTVIDLKETKKLESLALLWINLVDTLDTNHKGKLWFSRNIERTIRFGNSSKTNLFAFGITVLLDVLLSTLEDSLPLLLVCLQIKSQPMISLWCS
jgi:hypothetical protein